MSRSYWRDVSRPIIARVISEVGLENPRELRKALIEAYPFGERSMHPYKIWCSEVRYQTGKEKAKPGGKTDRTPAPNQMTLFGGETDDST